MFNAFDSLASACLSVILATPIVSGKATVIFTPLAFLCIAGMFVKLIMVTLQTQDALYTLLAASQPAAAQVNCADL